MNCDYCNSGKSIITYDNVYDEIMEVYITGKGDLKLKVDSDGFVEEKINFCPMCGKKL